MLTADKPTGQLPWPTVDGSTPDTSAKWDAVRLDTMESFDNGVVTLPAECPPPPDVPSAPEGLTATPGDTIVTLHWSPPTSDGGSPITGYVVEESFDGTTTWATVSDGDGDDTDTRATITGLKNGTLYYFRILAVNDNGTGPPSVDVKATPQLGAATYGVSVTAVCVDLTPFVDVVSTGTGDIRVSVGPESVVLTADQADGAAAVADRRWQHAGHLGEVGRRPPRHDGAVRQRCVDVARRVPAGTRPCRRLPKDSRRHPATRSSPCAGRRPRLTAARRSSATSSSSHSTASRRGRRSRR